MEKRIDDATLELMVKIKCKYKEMLELNDELVRTQNDFKLLPKYLQKDLQHIHNTVRGCVSRYVNELVNIYGSLYENGVQEVVTIRHKPNILKAVKNAKGGRILKTLNGPVFTNEGDYIITGVNGEQYPCDPEIFKELYEVVDGE